MCNTTESHDDKTHNNNPKNLGLNTQKSGTKKHRKKSITQFDHGEGGSGSGKLHDKAYKLRAKIGQQMHISIYIRLQI